MIEFILWGRKATEAAYMESVIAECKTREEATQKEQAAKAAGYITRVMTFKTGMRPDFVGAIAR